MSCAVERVLLERLIDRLRERTERVFGARTSLCDRASGRTELRREVRFAELATERALPHLAHGLVEDGALLVGQLLVSA